MSNESSTSTTYGTTVTTKRNISTTRVALSQVIAINVNNILLLSNGMVGAYPTILIPALSDNKSNDSLNIKEDQISWIGSISFMCALISCLLSGVITQPVGRTRAMHGVAPILFLSWLIFQFANQVWHIYLALSLCGFTASLIESPILSYKAETCQPHLRGMLSATSTLSVIIGVLLQFILGTFFNWRTAAVISSIFPLTTCILLFFIPESPHWLIMHNKKDQAHKSLAWLRGWTTLDDVKEEFEEICSSNTQQGTQTILDNDDTNTCSTEGRKKFVWKTEIGKFTKKSFLWPLALVVFIYFISHFTGLCTLQTYAVNIFATLQAPMDKFYATLILGVTEVVGTFVSVFFVRYYGKRVMGFVSVGGVAICNIGVGIYAYIIDVKNIRFDDEIVGTVKNEYTWLPLTILICMAFVGHTGIRVLPWILLGEIFSHEARAVGCGIGSASYNLLAFLANKLFLVMIRYLAISGVYWFYAALSILGFVVMYFYLPETEGKNLEEVIHHFAGISKLDNRVRRNVGKRDQISQSVAQTSTSAL